VVISPLADLAISANPSILTVQAGHSVLTTISVTSAFYFVGIVSIEANMQGGMARLNITNAFLDVGRTIFARLNVTVDPALTPGSYMIMLTIYSGSEVTHALGLTLTVTASVDTSTHVTLPTIFGLAPIIYFGIIGAGSVILALLSRRSYRKNWKQ
jgi:hypothetical protein